MAAQNRSRLEGVMPDNNYDETGAKYRIPETKPDRSGQRVVLVALLVMVLAAAGFALSLGWQPFG